MKTLKDLTPEIRAKIPEYIAYAKDALYNGTEWSEYDPQNTVDYIHFIYKLADKPLPKQVLIAQSPTEYKQLWNQHGSGSKSHFLFLASLYSRAYLARYYFIHKELGVDTKLSKDLTYAYHNVN